MRAPRLPAILLALALGAGCRRSEPLRVGLVAGLSGRHYDLGVACRNGAQLAVEDVNAAGGVRGRALELLVRDDAQDPEVARRAVRELIDAGVVAIVGHCTSAMAQATLPIANEARVLMISPTVSSAALLGKDDWLILADASGTTTAEGLADYFVRTRDGHTVTVLLDASNRAYADPWRRTFTASLEASGGRIARVVEFTSGQVGSYAALAGEALADEPDAVLLVANAFDTAMLAQQIRKRTPGPAGVQLLGTGWSFTDDLVRHGGSAVERALFVHKVNPDDTRPPATRFRTIYAARFGTAPFFAAIEAYDSVQLLAAGLARDPTREGVRREILSLGTFRGLTEEFAIDSFGDAHRRNHISTVRDGRFLLVE
jgi:branched-chain amino acid transport system substrate-binding protein